MINAGGLITVVHISHAKSHRRCMYVFILVRVECVICTIQPILFFFLFFPLRDNEM